MCLVEAVTPGRETRRNTITLFFSEGQTKGLVKKPGQVTNMRALFRYMGNQRAEVNIFRGSKARVTNNPKTKVQGGSYKRKRGMKKGQMMQ